MRLCRVLLSSVVVRCPSQIFEAVRPDDLGSVAQAVRVREVRNEADRPSDDHLDDLRLHTERSKLQNSRLLPKSSVLGSVISAINATRAVVGVDLTDAA